LVHFIAIYVDCNKALKSTNLCMQTLKNILDKELQK
jgi:hypothetical protein